METISAVLCWTCCFSPPSTKSVNAALQPKGLYLGPNSLFPLVFTFEPHNTWLQYSVSLIGHGSHMHCRSHTCDADTAGKEVGFLPSRGCVPGPFTLPSLPCPRGGSGFTKAPANRRRTRQLSVSFWTPKIQLLPRPLSTSWRSPHPLTSHISPSSVGTGVGREDVHGYGFR